MPRFSRQTISGTTTHIISRFVDKQRRLEADEERNMYQSLAERAAREFDWAMLAYSLMSTHTHLAAEAGSNPLSKFCERLHSPLARWLNDRQGRLGPVFADRPKTIDFEPNGVADLIAYIHNNPVRAGLVEDPADSDWTSHRAYIGVVEPAPWIDVELGLRLCGFSSSRSGRQEFHEFVVSNSNNERSPLFSGDGARERRSELRTSLGAPVEATSARLIEATGALVQDPVVRPGTPLRSRWEGDLVELVEQAADSCGVTFEAIRSRTKRAEVVAARRVAIIAAHEHLGRTVTDIAAVLGISTAAGCNLLRRSPELVSQARDKAAAVTEVCRQRGTGAGGER